jgi:hypothetical protein
MTAGTLMTEISVTHHHIYLSPTPEGDIASKESVLATRLRVSMALPGRLHVWLTPQVRRLRWTVDSGEGISEGSGGDTWLGLRLCPPGGESLLRLGVAGMALLPTGGEGEGGRPGDFTTGSTDYAILALCDLDLSRFVGTDRCVVHFNVGYRWHQDAENGSRVWPDVYPAVPAGENGRFNNQLLLRVGWRYMAHGISMETEFRGDQFVHAGNWIGWRQNPLSISAGLRAWLGKRVWIRVGGEVAFSKGEPASSQMPDPDEEFPDWVIGGSIGRTWSLF